MNCGVLRLCRYGRGQVSSRWAADSVALLGEELPVNSRLGGFLRAYSGRILVTRGSSGQGRYRRRLLARTGSVPTQVD